MNYHSFFAKIKSIFLIFLLNFLIVNKSSAQVDCSTCTSNDFTFNSFYVGDINGIQLTNSCTIGTPQTAYLWMNVTNSSTRYSLKVHYILVEHDLINNTTISTTVDNCLYDQVAIPNSLINLGTINWTCGNALEITNFQMHWKQNNSISCSYDAPKCLCVADTYIAAPLVASYTYSTCNNGATSTVNFVSNLAGGTAPFTYSWNFGDATSSNSINPSHTYTNPGPYTATLTVTDNNSVTSVYSQVLTFAAQISAPTVS
ncbi:MAG: PKD domain-containing protein, partial [Dolichospermum sp.]